MEENKSINNEWDIDNLPNRLTMFRVLLIPIIIGTLSLIQTEWQWAQQNKILLGYIAGRTCVVASITDFFDGWIARRRGIVTLFGSFLDPIADKFLVVSSLILLQALDRVHVLIVIVLVLREIYITALRLLAYERELIIPVSKLAKWKTALQLVAIPMLMPDDIPWGIPMTLIGQILISICTLLSVYSALEYSYNLIKRMKHKRIKDEK
ncbi:MAG: CDP-diacylglycerol--glycerol-3-phosphate 3-phosphatidyltransferase [Bacteriovoracaceae bacterium]